MRRCTSRAPAFRTMRTSLRLVVPRTSESSTRITLLPASRCLNRIQLQLDAEVADRLRGLDERAADVVIANQPMPERNARFGRVAKAAATPESGTGTTMSASTGYSRASSRPIISRDSWTERPKTVESGREK